MTRVPVIVKQVLDLPLEEAIGTVAPMPLPLVFKKKGILPAVVAVEDQTGAWDAVGQTRTIRLSDGGQFHEELTRYDVPAGFSYRLTGLTGPLKALVSGAEGDWSFAAVDARRTEVTWTYTFLPKSGRTLLIRAVLVPLWRGYAAQNLRNVADYTGPSTRSR
ncbi:MAG: hypothetical protein JWO22_2529 [Frankiales bacterium]|nr:hypothetical protein [Frankiales bacterium]